MFADDIVLIVPNATVMRSLLAIYVIFAAYFETFSMLTKLGVLLDSFFIAWSDHTTTCFESPAAV